MANNEHLELLQQGKDVWNLWRKNRHEIRPDLVEADLSNFYLREFDLSRARLNAANLSKADLYGADLSGSSLNGANLSEAYPVKANLCGADLSGANLKNALLVKANLCGCRLNGCDLSDAHLSKASLNRADLSGAKLSDTRLNGADLNEANLSSLNLGTADLTDIELAEPKGWIEIPLPYTLRNLTPLPNTTSTTIDSDDRAKDEIEEEAPTQQNFPVGRHPQIILQDILAPITVRSWSEPTILLETTGELENVKQDGDLLLITGCDRPLTLRVPLIKHGTLALQSTLNSIITTAIQASRISG